MWVVLWLVWCVAAESIFRLARACGLGEFAGWGLVAWLTTYPHFAYYHGHLMTEAATVAFTLANLAIGVRFVFQPTLKSCVALAVVSAAAHLTRTQTLLPLFAIWGTALLVERRPRLLAYAACFLGVHAALIAPWLWRMNSVGGGATSVELKLGSNLYNYSGAMGDGYNAGGDPVVFPPDIEAMTPAERQGLLMRAAVDGIRRRPGVYFRTCLDRLGYLLSPLPNFAPASPLKTAAFAASTIAFLYVPLVAIVAAIIAGRTSNRAAWVLFATLLLWYGFHTLIHASVRQRLPCDPVAATLAALLWSNGGRKLCGNETSPSFSAA